MMITDRLYNFYDSITITQNNMKANYFNMDPLDYIESQYTPQCLFNPNEHIQQPSMFEQIKNSLTWDNPFIIVLINTIYAEK